MNAAGRPRPSRSCTVVVLPAPMYGKRFSGHESATPYVAEPPPSAGACAAPAQPDSIVIPAAAATANVVTRGYFERTCMVGQVLLCVWGGRRGCRSGGRRQRHSGRERTRSTFGTPATALESAGLRPTPHSAAGAQPAAARIARQTRIGVVGMSTC